MQRHFILLFVLFHLGVCFLLVQAFGAPVLSHCEYNKECLVELPGSKCADGTASYFTITERENAEQLLIYLSGGGACWSKGTCRKGLASPLTRVAPYNDWNDGGGIKDSSDPANPYAKNFSVVSIPYCTGDVHTGDRIINYGDDQAPYVVQHHGYQNVLLALESIKQLFPDPEKVVLYGCSAGGIGAYYHLRNVSEAYPNAKRYVVSDAGTPFLPPYIYTANYEKIMRSWGADKTLPEMNLARDEMPNLGDVIKFNGRTYSDTRFGFISSYRDRVMTFFSIAAGTPFPLTAVRRIIIDVADRSIGTATENQKVFYIRGTRHCQGFTPLARTISEQTSLSQWLSNMLDDRQAWANIRPDLR